MVKLCSIFLLFFFALPGTSHQKKSTSNCSLFLEFSNIRNNQGKIFIFLYNYKNQYPDNPYKYYEIDKSSVKNNRLTFAIDNLNKGNYAISIIDDENSNDDLDLFWGIPTEGYAFSNNIRPFLSFPDYEELLFSVQQSRQRLRLNMIYII